MENHYSESTSEGYECHKKQKSVVSLDRVPKPGHMAENRCEHGARCQNPTRPAQTWDEQTNRSEQFPNPLPPAPPRLRSHFLKDVNRLRSGSEFEEERFEHDAGRDELANPADYVLACGQRVRWLDRSGGAPAHRCSGRSISLEIFDFRQSPVCFHGRGWLPEAEVRHC